MSLSAYLTAVRDALRSGMPLLDRECNVEPDAQPHPSWSGLKYIAVHPVAWRPSGLGPDRGLDETIDIDCAINFRLTRPQDLIAEGLFLKAFTGMEALARKATALIHQNYDVMNAANALIIDIPENEDANPPITAIEYSKFLEPLVWNGTDATPAVKTGEWLFSDNEKDIDKPAALVLSVHFTGARRIQPYATMQ